jgi:cysteinyl-tRNA synthetase
MYDSATRSVRDFEPLVDGQLGVYNCGPTVYDWQHIGNLYSYLTADIVRRTFEYFGYRVKQVTRSSSPSGTRSSSSSTAGS